MSTTLSPSLAASGGETAAADSKLAVLQAYPLGTLQVICPMISNPAAAPEYFTVTGLISNGSVYLNQEFSVQAEDVTPLLFGFDALTTALGDGSVPAVEVAKILYRSEKHCNWALATAEFKDKPLPTVEIVIPDTRPAYFPGRKTLWDDWSGLNTEVTDYLRSQGFALPVNGRPLIEGVDYIAKGKGASNG